MKKQLTVLLPFILVAALLLGSITLSARISLHTDAMDGEVATVRKLTNSEDIFKEVVAKYLAANPKPQLPEEVRKFRVQAEFAVKEKQFDKAAELYGKALEFAPWWPQGYFNRALILGELKRFGEATREMKRYVRLVPDAPDARAAQDRIYEWEGAAKLSKPGYEGDIVNGKAHGKGSFTWPNGDRYEGDFIDGKRTGKGILTWVNGNSYEGNWVDDKTGKGVHTWASGERYEGNWVNAKRTGKGVYTWLNGDRYEGDFVDDKLTGKGIFTGVNGNSYEGNFVDGKTGKGVYTWPNGNRYEGGFVYDKKTGKGIFTWANGDRYEGGFVDDKLTGKGVRTNKNGTRYEGDWVGGSFTQGVATLANGDRNEGPFVKLGTRLGSLSPASANELHKPDLKGAHVVEVIKGSVADKSGISRDDVVVEWGEKPITNEDDLLDAIIMTKPGQTKKIKIVRGIQEIVLTAQF